MLKSFRNWLNDRTSYRQLLAPIRRRILPSGPSWGYTTANCLLWLLVIEVVTGFLMMASYSPSASSAWASVHFIEQSAAGSFIRGLHYWIAQAMIILFGIHLIRVLISAAFRAPRELIWGTGLILLPLFIVWAITGNPLAGSQIGYSQIEVEGNIIGSTPILGPIIQRLLIGGDEVGNLTLTHLYFLHVGLMPLVVGTLLGIHIAQIYKHGSAASANQDVLSSPRPYFPDQTVRNMIVLSIVLGTVAVLAWRHGAPLAAPADPQLHHSPRPEWYFLFLFELRAYFVGQWEFIATMVIPMAALFLLLFIPAIDRIVTRFYSDSVSWYLRFTLVSLGVAAWVGLTMTSVLRDLGDKEHQAALAEGEHYAARARELADRGRIPPIGAIALLRNDPQTQGPILFKQHCSSCHSHTDEKNQGIVAESPSAPNLHGFASREWIAGLLDPEKIASEHYFANTEFAGGEMESSIVEAFDDVEDEPAKAALRKQMLSVAAALSAEAKLSSQKEDDLRDAALIAAGAELLIGDLSCTDCHKFHDEGELGSAPDLTHYGSYGWLREFLANPAHERFYSDSNDRMPAFAENADKPDQNLLSENELRMLSQWIRNDEENVEEESEPAAEEEPEPVEDETKKDE